MTQRRYDTLSSIINNRPNGEFLDLVMERIVDCIEQTSRVSEWEWEWV
ncbi:MAG TPA: hypothetical protein VIU13_04355 [Chryseolinea sp.]